MEGAAGFADEIDGIAGPLRPMTPEAGDGGFGMGDIFSGITVANYDYGVFVSVPGTSVDIDELTAPEDLKHVLRFAREAGCDVVRFDTDGDTEAALPSFDW